MRAKSGLIIACLAVAFFITFGATNAQAQCCFGKVLSAPFVAAATVVGTAASAVAAVITAPFTAFHTCGFTACTPCGHSHVSTAPPGNYG